MGTAYVSEIGPLLCKTGLRPGGGSVAAGSSKDERTREMAEFVRVA
jgi:hypothetical protein